MGTGAFTVLPDAEALAQAAAQWLTERVLERPDGAVAVALSGGSTPRQLYERLSASPFRDRFPWARVHWFWGDERFVPPDDPRSNQRMARAAMLSRVPVPDANIHPIPTVGIDPREAARAYQRDLMAFYGAAHLDPARPLFDVTLLGLGSDGHTASLFPGTPALDERDDWAAAVLGVQPEARITLTFPALESSRHVAVLVTGEDKRAILARVRRGDTALPAARLRPAGTLTVFADAAASGGPTHAKRRAARAAVEMVEDGMVLGLGSGSTAELALEALAERIARGLRVQGIPTSERTAAQARRLGIPLTDFAAQTRIDLTIDGADEVERGTLTLIKGHGGALLREKIVASASRRLVVIVDEGKMVERLGRRTALPVEIVPFGAEATMQRLQDADANPVLRLAGGAPFVSDGGHHIVDCGVGEIRDPAALHARLRAIVGVIETGLFIGLASSVVVGTASGVEVIPQNE